MGGMGLVKKEQLKWAGTGAVVALAFLSFQSLAQVLGVDNPTLPTTNVAIQFSGEQLSAAMATELVSLPSAALKEDYEASLMFVIGQQDYPIPIIIDALDQLEARPSMARPYVQAIEQVRQAVLRRQFRGTAALAGTRGDSSITGFSFPVISINSGSSNYDN